MRGFCKMKIFQPDQFEKIQNKRNHLIDLLRLLAASWVALFHFNQPIPYVDTWYREFCRTGHYGVPVFFIISGYCIRIAQQQAKTANDYIIRRLFRILPPYWFSIFVVGVCILVLKIITGSNYVMVLPKNIQGIAATLFLYTEPISHFKTINWVYWTLPYELLFYIIVYFSMLLPSKSKLLLLSLLSGIAIIIPLQVANPLFFFNEFPTFMLGYSLYLLINKTENIWLSYLILILSITGYIIKHPSIKDILVAAMIAALIIANSFKPLKNNIFSKLGDYSYSLYLIHVPLGCWLFGFIKNMKMMQNNISLNIIADLIILIMVLFVSRLMFYYVELPSIALGKSVSKMY